MEYRIPYTSWDGFQKTWNPKTEGVFCIRVKKQIDNTNGSYFNESALGRFTTHFDLMQAYHGVLCVRPDLKDVIEPVKAPCVFDAAKNGLNVERW